MLPFSRREFLGTAAASLVVASLPRRVLSADWVLPVEGPPIEAGAVVIEDDRIAAVGTAEGLGEGTRYDDAVIVPGCPSEDDGSLSACQMSRAAWAAILWQRGVAGVASVALTSVYLMSRTRPP